MLKIILKKHFIFLFEINQHFQAAWKFYRHSETWMQFTAWQSPYARRRNEYFQVAWNNYSLWIMWFFCHIVFKSRTFSCRGGACDNQQNLSIMLNAFVYQQQSLSLYILAVKGW